MQEHQPVPNAADVVPPPSTAEDDPDPFGDPRSLQILTTEHWSLLATRSLSWNESFSRAGLFLSVVSATAVALALVGQATGFNDHFTAFALVMLPIALFIGLATFSRLDEVNAEDFVWVAGMNRIRHAYLQMNPRLQDYFITGWTDDPAGMERTFGIHRPGSAVAHWVVTMPGMVAVIDGVLGGLVVGLTLSAVSGMQMTGSIAVGLIVAVVIPVVLAIRSRNSVRWFLGVFQPRFPSGSDSLYDWSGSIRGGSKDGPGKPRA